jgi:hypothetical protein
MMSAADILDAALKLSEQERISLASRLLESVPEEELDDLDKLDDEQFNQELLRRCDDWDGAVMAEDL